jgi:hypothetical protein
MAASRAPSGTPGDCSVICDRRELFARAGAAIAPAEILLDIGPGIRPQPLARARVHILCEPHREYLDALALTTNHATTYVKLQASWSEAVKLFPPSSVDTVVVLDVIEHLEKDEGRVLLERTVELARKQVVIFTPYGFVPLHAHDGKDRWGMSGGALQEHRSGWLPEDFGPEWSFFVCHDFHDPDPLEGRLERAGAFFAILDKEATRSRADFSVARIHSWLFRIAGPLHRAIDRLARR